MRYNKNALDKEWEVENNEGIDSLSDNEKRNMLASVANLYYNAEMTQNQIAERFLPHVLRFQEC